MIFYSPEFDPPAPVLAVQMTGIVHSRLRVTLPALLDTGSDFTAIPTNLVARLKLSAVRPVRKIFLEKRETSSFTAFVLLSECLKTTSHFRSSTSLKKLNFWLELIIRWLLRPIIRPERCWLW